jgi:GT2 family glycosyltransferase
MSKNRDLVSFVVLNWNGISDTLVCLDSIRKQTYENYEIIVVDNGSAEHEKETLRAIDDIILVEFPVNTGFTGGQIAGAGAAKGAYLALINNDSVIAPDWCAKSLELVKSLKKVGAVGGRAYTWDVSLKQKPFSDNNPFYSFQVMNPKSGHTKTLSTGSVTTPVNSISGSAVMINRRAIDRVGYFDDRFFAYYEETDLFARMKRAGYQIIYSPDIRTWHKIGQSTRSNPGFYPYHMHRNRFMFAVKNFDKQFVMPFVRIYLREWLRSVAISLRRGKKAPVEQLVFARAGLWNIAHLPATLALRRKVQKLGPTYSKLLAKDAQEDITIIIPCYNYANYVTETLESIVEQTLQPNEVIVIDDGSKDNSREIINSVVERLAKKHPSIEFIVLGQKNQGVIATKNRGLSLARSQWIVFLDADDTIDLQYLEKCMSAQHKTGADVVYTDMQMFGAIDYVQRVLPYNKNRLRSVNFIHNSALYNASLLRQAGGYSPAFKMGYEDWEINLKISKLTNKFCYIPEPLLNYRRHEGASRDNNAQQKLVMVTKLLEKIHPELYNLRYYWWLETNRAIDSAKRVAKYPFLLIKHTYYHTIMSMDRRAKQNRHVKRAMNALRAVKRRRKVIL